MDQSPQHDSFGSSDTSPPHSSPRPTALRPRGKRGPLPSSCKECRRLKLRCNVRESLPCENCQKRGRAHLCPDGSLYTVPRIVKTTEPTSNSETQQLKTRIRQLEAALRQSHKSTSSNPHPLLAQEPVFPIEDSSSPDPDDELTKSFGTLTIEEDSGRTQWYGATAASEHFLSIAESNPPLPLPPVDNSVDPELIVLGRMYSLSTSEHDPVHMRTQLGTCAPPRLSGEHWLTLYHLYGTWLVSPFSRDDFYSNVFEPLYTSPDWTDVPFDCIALFYAVLAVGVLYADVLTPKKTALKYHQLACAALAMARFEDVPTLRCIQTLIVLAWQTSAAESNLAQNRAWTQIGTAMRLAQSIGLQRDGKHWSLEEKVLQSRRRLFYELHYYDSVMSLWFGRPRAALPSHFDCQLPDSEEDYDATKLRFVSGCLGEVLDKALAVKPPQYSAILELDKKIRNFHIAVPTLPAVVEPSDFNRVAATHSLLSLKESAIMYLHRPFYFQSIKDITLDIFTSKYALSVIAVQQSACAMIRHVHTLFHNFPTVAPQVYTHALDAFSASITLSTLVIRAPRMSLAHTAMQEVETAYEMFRQAAGPSRVRISLALPIIRRLRDMARAHYDTAQVGGNHVPGPCSSTDELDRLIGGVLVVEKKVTPVAGAETYCTSTSGSKKPTVMTGAIQVSAAIAPSTKSPLEFALENVHPTLAQEFTVWTESGESSSLYQHSHHSDQGEGDSYGTTNRANDSIESWLGMQPTNDLLGNDPFDLLYGDFWSNMMGGTQENMVQN